MKPETDEAASHLAANLRSLRQARGYTQRRAAELAGVPRATWASLESGSANPTLQVLLAATRALQTNVEELLAPPRATGRLVRAGELKTRQRGKVEVRELLPEPLPGVTLQRLRLARDGKMVGVPHTAGTREYLTCESGQLRLTASGQAFDLQPGDVVVFRGDQKHAYENLHTGVTVAYSVVLLRT